MPWGARMGRVCAAVGAAAMLAAAPGHAAFPGGNGLLAVVPAGGHGVVLAAPNGGVVRVLCPGRRIPTPVDQPGPPSCDGVTSASFSPDGSELVLVQRIGGPPLISVVYEHDGSCLSCTMVAQGSVFARPVEDPGQVTDPVFAPSGSSLEFGVAGTSNPAQPPVAKTIATENIDGGAYSQLSLGGHASQPAVSASGRLAFVLTRHGHRRVMVLGTGKHARPVLVASGQSPNWSPNGRRLAFVSHGWVWVLRVGRSGRPASSFRVVRGSDPAWSPRGRFIAYLARGGAVRIARVRDGHSFAAGTLRGIHLDWQPVPLLPPRCPIPLTATLDARGPNASAYNDGVAELGCLTTTGTLRVLGRMGGHSAIGMGDFKFTGTLAAYLWSQGQDYPPCFPPEQYVTEVDLATGTLLVSDKVQDNCLTDPDRRNLDGWGLGTNGGIAYLTDFGPTPGNSGTTTYTVTAHDNGGIRQLDSASTTTTSTPPLANLTVSGNTVSWTHNGQPRSATLGGAP